MGVLTPDNVHAARGLMIEVDDLIEVLTKRNPTASRAEVESFGALLADLGNDQQRPVSKDPESDLDLATISLMLVRDRLESDAELKILIDRLLFELGRRLAESSFGDASRHPRSARASGERSHNERPVEIHNGTGLGERLTRREGERRMAAYAADLPLDRWAGPLADLRELPDRLGLPRSKIAAWRRSGAIIELRRDGGTPVFPLAQFVDGMPVKGLAEAVDAIGDAQTAWLWLIEPRKSKLSPLEELARGNVAAVLEAARDDFA